MNEKTKKIIFKDTDIRHAQLKIRLQQDGLTQAEFFRSLISGYLNENKNILRYIKNYKEVNKTQSKRILGVIEKDKKASDDLMSKFGIEDDELENIFDLIAEEYPDL
tara:strand:+ start:8634 stop:8954 length:321 start_codon:yes stop_codon:yes gene_type:complete